MKDDNHQHLAEAAVRPAPALLVFADDWGRHPSSCQHLIGHLLGRYRVIWVNTIGTRAPRLNLATLRRGLEKLCQWTRTSPGPAALPEHLRVVNPRMWPWFSSAFDRRLNRRLLTRQLTQELNALLEPPVAVTTVPLVADLVGELPVRRWVYYCVDDFEQWPGLDGVALRRMEEVLVRGADTLIAAGDALQEKLAQMGRPAHVLTHGVDLAFWTTAPEGPGLPQLDSLERPLLAFWGLIDRRMDVAFLRHLAADLDRGTIVLAGPESDPDPALFASRRVVRLGKLPFAQLPRLAREAGVLLMPYGDLPVTRAMQPLKLKEYLATGRPVVARALPATRCFADCLDLADTPEAFAEAVRVRQAEGLSEEQRRARGRLAGEGWADKARLFEKWALLPRPALEPAACP
jgi:glycosyltransferase involved in cell wall biosynthesis